MYTPYSINKKMIVATDRFRFGRFCDHWKAEGAFGQTSNFAPENFGKLEDEIFMCRFM